MAGDVRLPPQALEAAARFQEGCNCAQAVFATFAERLGMDGEIAIRAATAFGAGIARRGGMCGAVSGGLMVIGLAYGGGTPEAKNHVYALANEFMRRFEGLHGSLLCNELTGIDICDPVARQTGHDQGVYARLCPHFVEAAASLLVELLDNSPPEAKQP